MIYCIQSLGKATKLATKKTLDVKTKEVKQTQNIEKEATK